MIDNTLKSNNDEEQIEFTDINDNNFNAEYLSSGGQGAVYTLKDYRNLVVKVCTTPEGTALRDEDSYDKYSEKIDYLSALPSINNVAFPIRMLKRPTVGYMMRLMEDMHSMEDDMLIDHSSNETIGTVYQKTGGLKRRIEILTKLARIILDMQKKGIVYADISPKNVFISKNYHYSEVWLIDTDNMHFENDKDYATSVGTPNYRAPEIFLQRQNTLFSDEYSFALLAYEFLTFNKAFEGKAANEVTEDDWGVDEDDFSSKVERGEIPWVNQYDAPSNRTTTGIPCERVCTQSMMDLFEQTFNAGRINPSKRPSMLEWYYTLLDAERSIVDCPNGHSHFGHKCLWCNTESEIVTATAYKRVYFTDDEGEKYSDCKCSNKCWIEEKGKPVEITSDIIDGFPQSGIKTISTIYRQINGYQVKNSGDAFPGCRIKCYQNEFLVSDNKYLSDIDGLEIRIKKDNYIPYYIVIERRTQK